jgi:hypothetical protein
MNAYRFHHPRTPMDYITIYDNETASENDSENGMRLTHTIPSAMLSVLWWVAYTAWQNGKISQERLDHHQQPHLGKAPNPFLGFTYEQAIAHDFYDDL